MKRLNGVAMLGTMVVGAAVLVIVAAVLVAVVLPWAFFTATTFEEERERVKK